MNETELPRENNSAALERLLARPLIVGASVSADYAAPSPGKILALRSVRSPEIRVIAAHGFPSTEIWPRVSTDALRDRSVMIGVDLFFWDSTVIEVEPSLRVLEGIVETAGRARLPIVIGDVPELLDGHQTHREELNHAIHAAARTNAFVRVFDLDRIHRDARRLGGVRIGARVISIRELVPDGVHLGHLGGEFLADELAQILEKWKEPYEEAH